MRAIDWVIISIKLLQPYTTERVGGDHLPVLWTARRPPQRATLRPAAMQSSIYPCSGALLSGTCTPGAACKLGLACELNTAKSALIDRLNLSACAWVPDSVRGARR